MIDYQSIFREFVRGHMSEFYALMYPGLLTFASRLLGPSLGYMAEDCVQDAVMNTYEARNELTDSTHWRRYLMQCVRHRAYNITRHGRVASGYETEAADAQADEEYVEPDVSYAIMHQETFDELFAAIDSLPPEYREIFELNFEQGLKNQEIARLIDVAEITVKKRKARMLEMLRARLSRDGWMLLTVYMSALEEVRNAV